MPEHQDWTSEITDKLITEGRCVVCGKKGGEYFKPSAICFELRPRALALTLELYEHAIHNPPDKQTRTAFLCPKCRTKALKKVGRSLITGEI